MSTDDETPGLRPEPHDLLLRTADEAIASTIAVIRKNGGTTSRWSMLIFDPVAEDVQPEGGWGDKLMCNGVAVLQMPSSKLAETLARYWNLDISADAAAALAAPNPEGVLRCVTVVGGIARPMDVEVRGLSGGGAA
jgi:hypothetical protein